MLYRLLILFYSFSSLASIPCPQNLETVGDEIDKVLALSPFSCVNKLQSFELTDANEFCSCQNDLPFKATKRDFQTENEKLREIGDALVTEIFSIADIMSELNIELSSSELQGVDLSRLSNCDLPSLLSEKNLSCGGNFDSEKLSTLFGSLDTDINPELVEVFGLKKLSRFKVDSLQEQIRQVVRVSTGDITLEGKGNFCLPPKYQYLVKESRMNFSAVGISEILRSKDLKMEESYRSSNSSNQEKLKLANNALTILSGRCEKIKKNINNAVCNKSLTKFRSAPGSTVVDNFFYNASVDVSNPDEIDSLIGKFNAACESIINGDEIAKNSLRNNVYGQIILSGADFDKLGPSELLLKNIKMSNDFPEKIVNHCEKICDDNAPYPKSGCKLKDVDFLYKEYQCDQQVKNFDENLICAFVDVEKNKKTEDELLKIAHSSNQEEIDAFMSSAISKEKKESFAKLMRFEKAKKEKVSVLDRFLDGSKEVDKKSSQVVAKSADSKVESIADVGNDKSTNIAKLDNENQPQAIDRKVSEQKVSGLTSSSLGSFAMSSSSRKSQNISTGKPSIIEPSTQKNENSSLNEESTKRISELMDRLDNAQKRVSNSLAKVDAQTMDKNSQVQDRQLSTRARSDFARGGGKSPSYSDRSAIGSSYGNVGGTRALERNTPVIEYEKVAEKPTDLIGRGSNGIAASDERGRRIAGNAVNNSAISKLFQGELSNALVKSKQDSSDTDLKRVQVPEKIKMIDLAKLLKNSSEISPGEAFILYELVEGRRVEVTLVPTFTKLGRQEVFTGYRPLNVDNSNKFLVRKLTAHKNLFKEI